MNEPHQRFHDWLTAGADGEPPRDAAVHASVCGACHQSIAALDLLAIVNTGLAAMPPAPTGREHGRLVMVGRLLGATAILFSAAILGIGVSQLIGVSQPNGPVAQASPTPEQSVLGATATPIPSATAEGSPSSEPTAQETLTPLGTPVPTQAPPAATPFPRRTPVPTPIATAVPTPSPTETPIPTPVPTPPSAPQSPLAVAPSSGLVEVTWQPPASDGGAPITSYRIYRSISTGPAVLLAEVSAPSFFFEDSSVVPNTTYTYVVAAVNSAGEGSGSTTQPVTTPPT